MITKPAQNILSNPNRDRHQPGIHFLLEGRSDDFVLKASVIDGVPLLPCLMEAELEANKALVDVAF